MVWTKSAIVWLTLAALGLLYAPSAIAQSKKKAPPVFNSPVPAPIIPPTLAPPAPPPSEAYGDWMVTRQGKDTYLASTLKDGMAFGVVCNASCYVIFNAQLTCDEKVNYPALIATPAGSIGVNLKCLTWLQRRLYTMKLSTDILDAMEIGGDLAIAFPVGKSDFKIVKFSMVGALKASVRAFDLAPVGKQDQGTSDKGLRDQTL